MIHAFVAFSKKAGVAGTSVLLAALLFETAPAAFADSLQFTLIPPAGDIAGGAGSTIGWGYSITDQSSADWLVTTSLNADSFLHGTPALLFDFPTVGPGQTATESFGATTGTGLYKLIWDAKAPLGFVNRGDFVLSAQWWSGNPSSGGTFLADAPDTSVPYSATVSVTTTPEPSTWPLLLIIASAVFAARNWNAARSSRKYCKFGTFKSSMRSTSPR